VIGFTRDEDAMTNELFGQAEVLQSEA